MRLNDIKNVLREEALDTIKAEDLWAENKDNAGWYATNTAYIVRPVKDTVPQQYEAFSVNGDKRRPFGKFTADELKKTLEPVRGNQTPDVEGFTSYKDPEKVEAFQYTGDATKVMLDTTTGARLSNSDYLIRSNDGNNFEYAIEKASAFEATLSKIEE